MLRWHSVQRFPKTCPNWPKRSCRSPCLWALGQLEQLDRRSSVPQQDIKRLVTVFWMMVFLLAFVLSLLVFIGTLSGFWKIIDRRLYWTELQQAQTFTVLVLLCLMGNFVMSICYSLYILAQVDIHCIWRCFALEFKSIDIDGLVTRMNWFRLAFEYPAMWKKGNTDSNARDQVEGKFNVDVLTCVSILICGFDSCAFVSVLLLFVCICVYIYNMLIYIS